ncbi:Cytosolic sulfotransferase 13 [Armadillidium vulgare]|nr:Sulfotransferase 1C4 [Armadillidium vulgare]RXG61241.1 Cytosolic sulfotransferase 13 [Armadillidium vulgare]
MITKNILGVEPYWEHVRLAWEKRNNPNFLFLYYEDLKENPKEQIKKVDQFIGTSRSDKQIDNIVHCTSFDYMKSKSKENSPLSFDGVLSETETQDQGPNFFRKGKVGSWREELPPHLQEKLNKWMRKNLTQFSDDFKYKAEEYY